MVLKIHTRPKKVIIEFPALASYLGWVVLVSELPPLNGKVLKIRKSNALILISFLFELSKLLFECPEPMNTVHVLLEVSHIILETLAANFAVCLFPNLGRIMTVQLMSPYLFWLAKCLVTPIETARPPSIIVY